jgi:hypothetical protein
MKSDCGLNVIFTFLIKQSLLIQASLDELRNDQVAPLGPSQSVRKIPDKWKID